MEWPSAIAHVDMDTFFVSVERKNDPSLIGKPVIVGGGRGGGTKRAVVAACSYETRKFGVHSAMPLSTALRLCPEAIVIPVGVSDYGAASAEVRAVLETFTDLVEMASPDEAYIDLAGTRRLHGPPVAAADKIRRMIAKKLGLPVSVGLATTRTHAKIASKLSKPQGLFAVLPGGEAMIVRPLALRALPGLGPKTASKLESHGFVTLGELLDAGEDKLGQLLGDQGRALHRRSRGEGSAKITISRDPVQISTEATYTDDISDWDVIEVKLARMTTKIGARLRKLDFWSGTLTMKIRYPDFTTLTRQTPLDPPTQDDMVLLREAKALLRKAWDGKTPLRLLGVGAAGLTEATQGDLFGARTSEKQERLLAAIDSISAKAGKGKIVWGATLPRGESGSGK